MFKSVPVDWVSEAYLVSGTNGSFTEFILYTHMSKTHQYNHCVGISFQLYYLPSRITLIEDQTNGNQLQMSHKLIPFKGVYDYFVLYQMFKNIRERKHVKYTHKIDNQLIPHNHETRIWVNNKLVSPRCSK